jgi:hypothetical protein
MPTATPFATTILKRFAAIFPCLLKTNGDTVLGRADDDGSIRSTERFHHGTGEVETAGGIQQVDLAIIVLQRHHSSGQGDMTANLFGIKITDGIAVGILADAVNGAGHVK